MLNRILICIYIHRTHSQVITVHHTSSLATMEGAFMIIIGVMAIAMTVEITVMKKDAVCDTRWEEVFYTCIYKTMIKGYNI